MGTRKKSILLLIAVLVIVASGYGILKALYHSDQTIVISAQANPTLTEKQISVTTNSTQTAMVEYWVSPAELKEYFLPIDSLMFDFVENEQDDQARLFINVIYAIDKDKVFLGGSLDFSNSNGFFERSVLLRSLDGGKHWTEVMQTARVSKVEHIIFLDQGEGWALVQGTGELGSVMPTILWHTANFGETWEIAGSVSTASDYTRSYKTLKFYSSTHGQISLTCGGSGMCKGGDYYSILSTQDGGVTWQESYHLTLPFVEGDSSYEKRLTAFILPKGGRYGSHVGNCSYINIQECPSYGQDGSEWQAEYSADKMNLSVRRRLPFESEWTTYAVPACVEYRQGKMMEACNDSP